MMVHDDEWHGGISCASTPSSSCAQSSVAALGPHQLSVKRTRIPEGIEHPR